METGPAPKKKSRRAFGASKKLARRRLAKNKEKYEGKTGQSVVAAAATSNSERAVERVGRAAVEKQLGTAVQQRDEALAQLQQAEKAAAESASACAGNVNLVRELTCEKDAALRVEVARRVEAEQEARKAVREKERAMEKKREAEKKALKMKAELRVLHGETKKLAAKNLQLCREAGFAGGSVEVEAEEGSTRCIEEELELERFRVARLERRMAVLQPRVDGLKKANTIAKKKVSRLQRTAALSKANGKGSGKGDKGGSGGVAGPSSEGGGPSGAPTAADDGDDSDLDNPVFREKMMRLYKRELKPGGQFGENTARMCRETCVRADRC